MVLTNTTLFKTSVLRHTQETRNLPSSSKKEIEKGGVPGSPYQESRSPETKLRTGVSQGRTNDVGEDDSDVHRRLNKSCFVSTIGVG